MLWDVVTGCAPEVELRDWPVEMYGCCCRSCVWMRRTGCSSSSETAVEERLLLLLLLLLLLSCFGSFEVWLENCTLLLLVGYGASGMRLCPHVAGALGACERCGGSNLG
jgi:hypothetical protein